MTTRNVNSSIIVARGVSARGITVARAVTSSLFGDGPPPVLPPDALTAPVVVGFAVPGETLTATPGTYTNSPTITGQWYRGGIGGAPIAGETALTYTAVQVDVMESIYYRETATNVAGAVSQDSNNAQDAIAAFASDSAHIDIFGAIPEALSPNASGALGITAGQSVQRMTGLIYGLSGPVISESVSGQMPVYDVTGGVPGVAFDGSNDRLVHEGTGLATRLSVNWSCELSVTARRSATGQPLWGTALRANATPFQRVCNIAGSGSIPGASNVRNSIRDDANITSNCVMVSSRTAIGTTWALRLSMRRTPTDQTITELQPDSGTNTVAVGTVLSQDRFAFGAFATPTAVSGYANMILHAAAFWDNGTPTNLSVNAARALMDLWSMP